MLASIVGGLLLVLLPSAFESNWAYAWPFYLFALGAAWGIGLDHWKWLWAPLRAGLTLAAVQIPIWMELGTWDIVVEGSLIKWVGGQFLLPFVVASLSLAWGARATPVQANLPGHAQEIVRATHQVPAVSGDKRNWNLALAALVSPVLAVWLPLLLLQLAFGPSGGWGAFFLLMIAWYGLWLLGPFLWGMKLLSWRELWAPAMAGFLFGASILFAMDDPFRVLHVLQMKGLEVLRLALICTATTTGLAAFVFGLRQKARRVRRMHTPAGRGL